MKYIKEYKEGDKIFDIYLCKHRQSAVTKNGKPYDNLILQDKTGTIDAKVWEPNSAGIAEFDALDYIEVYGDVTSFQGALQANIKRIRKCREGEFDPANYLPVSKFPIEDMYEELLIYDMEKQEYIEDEVLGDFVKENYKDRSNNGGSFFDLYFFMGEENILYLAGNKGLYRHVIGGSAIEQVIDGNLSIFNNPSYTLRGMLALDDSEFIALFGGGKVARFTYNPDIPTIPSETLKVYSLEENKMIRQAAVLYQAFNATSLIWMILFLVLE